MDPSVQKELGDRLSSLELNSVTAITQLKYLRKEVNELTQHLTGGGDSAKGLLHRVAQLEFSSTAAGKAFWLVVGSLTTAITAGVTLLVREFI